MTDGVALAIILTGWMTIMLTGRLVIHCKLILVVQYYNPEYSKMLRITNNNLNATRGLFIQVIFVILQENTPILSYINLGHINRPAMLSRLIDKSIGEKKLVSDCFDN